VIEQELTRARYSVIRDTGKEPVIIVAAPRLFDTFYSELSVEEQVRVTLPRQQIEWCGIPVIVNPYLPSDMAVMQDARHEIVAVIQL
jgi:hypothetical protein